MTVSTQETKSQETVIQISPKRDNADFLKTEATQWDRIATTLVKQLVNGISTAGQYKQYSFSFYNLFAKVW